MRLFARSATIFLFNQVGARVSMNMDSTREPAVPDLQGCLSLTRLWSVVSVFTSTCSILLVLLVRMS